MNTQPIDVETVNRPEPDQQHSQAVALRPQGGAVGQALAVDEILAQVTLIQNVMHKVMKEGEHFGTIPGCGDKKTLLQPGAQKLTMTFRLCPEYQIQEINIERGHKEYRIICTLKSMASGSFVGQGVGCCSTMESKYRFRGGSRKCPHCGKETIIKGKAEYGGGWLCFGKKGGCGAKWPDGAKEIESQSVEKVENDNPADHYNTVLKMAKKRAFVDATITATAASDIFTQDIGDEEGEPSQSAPPPPQHRQERPSAPPPQRPPQAAPKAPTPLPAPARPIPAKPANPPSPAKLREHTMRRITEAGLLEVLPEYLEAADIVLPTENLDDWPAQWLPHTKEEMDALLAKLKAFANGEKAERPFPPHEMEAPAKAPKTVKPAAAPEKPIEVPRDNPSTPAPSSTSEWFMDAIAPIPRKGQKRDEYLKAPDTIGSLFEARHGTDDGAQEARQRLWGFVNHFEPKGWQKRDGTQMPPSEADKSFRKALDAFAEWFAKNHPEEKL